MCYPQCFPKRTHLHFSSCLPGLTSSLLGSTAVCQPCSAFVGHLSLEALLAHSFPLLQLSPITFFVASPPPPHLHVQSPFCLHPHPFSLLYFSAEQLLCDFVSLSVTCTGAQTPGGRVFVCSIPLDSPAREHHVTQWSPVHRC